MHRFYLQMVDSTSVPLTCAVSLLEGRLWLLMCLFSRKYVCRHIKCAVVCLRGLQRGLISGAFSPFLMGNNTVAEQDLLRCAGSIPFQKPTALWASVPMDLFLDVVLLPNDLLSREREREEQPNKEVRGERQLVKRGKWGFWGSLKQKWERGRAEMEGGRTWRLKVECVKKQNGLAEKH